MRLRLLLWTIAISSSLPVLAARTAGAVLVADVPAPGSYVSPWRVILVLVGVGLWLRFCQWVDEDTQVMRRLNRELWNGVIVGAGVLGLALWLLLPWNTTGLFAAGFGLWLVITAGACSIYVVLRNGMVDAGVARVHASAHPKLHSRRAKEGRSRFGDRARTHQ